VLERASGDRVTLGVVGVQQVGGRDFLHDLGELPAEVHRVLHSELEPLPADRVVHVRRIARQQDPSSAVSGGLAGRVGEAR
jgi:hypothetical protein